MIIAIDGTTSSGKSTIAKELSKQMKICYVSTGSIYRAITLKCLNFGVDYNDNERLLTILKTTDIEYTFEKENTIIKVDGLIQQKNDLASPEVSSLTPKIACKDFVREYVRQIQLKLAKENPDIIIEGRDIGSVVFPNADFKFYIDADLKTRAERRFMDYIKQGKTVTLKQVIEDVQARDEQDQHRDLSPLIMTSDSILIDTTEHSVQECVKTMRNIINERINER